MRNCTKCLKPGEFYKTGSWCIQCRLDYQGTPQAQAKGREYKASERGRAKANAYNATPKAKAARTKYKRSEAGKASDRAYAQSLKGRLNVWKMSLKRKYNFSIEKYEAILKAQDNRCAICRASTPGVKNTHFHIDHDHRCCPGKKSCGKCIRGLLCGTCNRMLGMAYDNPETTRAATEYLASFQIPKTFQAGLGEALLF